METAPGWLHRLVAHLPDVTYRYRFLPTPGFDYVSPSAESLTGYAPREFYDRPHLLDVILSEAEVHSAALADSTSRSPVPCVRMPLRQKDGSIVSTDRWSVPVLDESGRLVAIEGLIREAVDLERLPTGSPPALAGTNAERQQFADFVQMVAHDIHQSIVTAQVYAGILQRALDVGDVVRATSSTSVVESAIEELDEMIRHFVDGILTESSEIRLVRELLDLTEYVSATIADLATTRGIDWIRLQGDQDVFVEADPRHLGRILDNLLTNALKYAEPRSPISVIVDTRDGRARVSVSDRGIGIAPADFGRLFQRGFRARDGARKSSGLGLGLYISRVLVEAHGGRIWAEANSDQGSTFFVELPLAPPPQSLRP